MKNVVVSSLFVVTAALAALTWSETTALPRGSWRHACATANGNLYFFGGGSGPESSCYFAPVNPDGTIGAWQPTTALPTNLGWFAAGATEGHVYVTGGWNPSGLTNAVRYSALDTAGPIGTWIPGTDLPTALYTHNAVLVDSCLYVIGGCAGIGTPTVPDVRFARVQPDGSLGSWTETSDLPQPVRLMGAAAYDACLYSVGGRGDYDAAYDAVYYARRNPGGELDDWQVTTSLPVALDGTTCAAVAGRLYACGGITTAGVTNAVFSAPINPDGTIGAWQSETSLPAARWAADGLAVGDHIYVTGGYSDGNGMAEVYYSSPVTAVAGPPEARSARRSASFCSGSVRFAVSASGPAVVSVIRPDGRVCLRRTFSLLAAGEHQLDLRNLAAGTYLLRVASVNSATLDRFIVLR